MFASHEAGHGLTPWHHITAFHLQRAFTPEQIGSAPDLHCLSRRTMVHLSDTSLGRAATRKLAESQMIAGVVDLDHTNKQSCFA